MSTGNFSSSTASDDSLVRAQRIVAKRSAALLAESLFPIRVADTDGENIYLNYGDSILSVGDQLTIVREGREIIDKDTGKVLGTRETNLGTVEVVSTDSDISVAKIIGSSFEINYGDRAKITMSAQESGNNQTQQRQPRGRRI